MPHEWSSTETGYRDDGLVFRSPLDDRVWMCNIPEVDVATGLQASTSLRRVKKYVESKVGGSRGTWVLSPEGTWAYFGGEE